MWTIDKLARLRMGYGVDNSCINCNANDKILAIEYIGWNTGNYAYCVTPNQTNNSIQINVQNYNRYSFDANGLWKATDWQAQSTQYFTNYGYKTVGAYSLYQKCGCSGGITTSLEFAIPVIQASFVSDNGTSCTIQIQNTSDSLYATGVTGYKRIWQEIGGVWTQLATATIPANTRGGTVTNNTNVTIAASQSSTPIHFKAEIENDTTGIISWTDMWLECLYTPIPPIPPTPPAQEFIDYGKVYCKIQNYKCIGRFADVEDLQEIADQKLVNILATNDTFFTSLL